MKAIKNGVVREFSAKMWFNLGHFKDHQGWQQIPDDYEQAAIPEELIGAVVQKKTIVEPEAVVQNVVKEVKQRKPRAKRNVSKK